MDQGPLVMDQIDAGARFLAEFGKRFPIRVAFWLKASDEGSRYLYVVSDQISDKNRGVAYGEVNRLAEAMRDADFDPFQVVLIDADDPLARAALDIHSRYPAMAATRLHGQNFGRVSIDEVYLYPPPLVIPAT